MNFTKKKFIIITGYDSRPLTCKNLNNFSAINKKCMNQGKMFETIVLKGIRLNDFLVLAHEEFAVLPKLKRIVPSAYIYAHAIAYLSFDLSTRGSPTPRIRSSATKSLLHHHTRWCNNWLLTFVAEQSKHPVRSLKA